MCGSTEKMCMGIVRRESNVRDDAWQRRTIVSDMEIVADAIDNAQLVIICLSDAYRQDNRSRAEAEYAVQCQRAVLPIMVRKIYKTDRWLSSLLGPNQPSVNYISSDFQTTSKLLLKQVNGYCRGAAPASRSATTTPVAVDAVSRSASAAMLAGRSQQTTPVNPISRSGTPGLLPSGPPIAQWGPAQYSQRNTSHSSYGSIPIHAWSTNEVLDFLYDKNLHAMMPLCESMTGQALIRLFRMCQRESGHLFNQLNNELRDRFNGLLLPIPTYKEFLTHMDRLMGSTPMAPISVPPPPRVLRNHTPMSNVTLNQAMGSSLAAYPARVLDSAVFRPASAASQTSNFTMESGQESSTTMEQVELYGNPLLFLDEKARENRDMNRHRQK